MFEYAIASVAALLFGGIAYKEASKTTAEKARNGDNVFVRADALRVQGTPGDLSDGGLASFLKGFLQSNVKITNLEIAAGGGRGTILGFSKVVVFPLSAIASIERDGKRIV
jgi:hypothetical protein